MAGIRELLGLPIRDPEAIAAQTGEFGQTFRAGIAPLNQDLQFLAAQSNPIDRQALDSQRQKLYQAYQSATALGDSAKSAQVMAAVAKVQEKASLKTAEVMAGHADWQAREAELADVFVKIADLEDAGHPKAAAYRKLSEAIRVQANERNYPNAIAALDQLQPKLEGLVADQLQLAGHADSSAPGGGSGNQPPFKGAHEVEIVNKTISKKTKYGELKLTATIKVMPTVGSDGKPSPVGSTTTGTSKIKDNSRQGGVKQNFSYQDIKNLKILDGLDISDISLGVEGEWSGTEIMASAVLKGKINTSLFSAPVSTKFILFTVKEGESPKFLGVEVKISPQQFTVKVAGVETPLFTEYKATFVLDRTAVGKEILEKIVEKKLKAEAKKQGVKMLLRKGGEKVLTKLGPLATAFGVGWDIGTLLNKYTVADEVAQSVIESIMGDFAEQWQNADTLGRMLLIHRNSPRIIAALIAGGVAGVAAGVGDIVLFKIMHLDMVGPAFNQALTVFENILANIPNFGEGMMDMITSNAIKMGIKFNPKYRTIADPSLNRLALAVYAELKPVYKKEGGLNEIISFRLQDTNVDPSDLRKFAELILAKKLQFPGINLNDSPEELVIRLLDFSFAELLIFLETHRLITYSITFDNNLSMDSIPEDLLIEVFG